MVNRYISTAPSRLKIHLWAALALVHMMFGLLWRSIKSSMSLEAGPPPRLAKHQEQAT
jgi:hypothetical protein